jgi:hypothetical protein
LHEHRNEENSEKHSGDAGKDAAWSHESPGVKNKSARECSAWIDGKSIWNGAGG